MPGHGAAPTLAATEEVGLLTGAELPPAVELDAEGSEHGAVLHEVVDEGLVVVQSELATTLPPASSQE